MAKNINHIQHVKSNVVDNGKPKLPASGVLVEGELAVNYADGYETISIENTNNEIVTFSSDEYYSRQKLGSAFTGVNSAVTVTDLISEVEISSGITPANESAELWVDTSVEPITVEVYTKSEVDSLLETKSDVTAVTEVNNTLTAHTADTTVHFTTGTVQTIIEDSALWVSGTGENSVILKNSSGTASGNYSVAEGYRTKAEGHQSHTEGYATSGTGYQTHAEGYNTLASGNQSHAEGQNTIASGLYSHAEGNGTTASGQSSHAEGEYTIASGEASHAEGVATTAGASSSHAEGQSTSASSYCSHAEGNSTIASGYYSHAEGNSTSATNYSSHAEGQGTNASGQSSHAEGTYTTASGNYSHAEGSSTQASGYTSHAEGYSTQANGSYSHAEGYSTIASGDYSHAEGYSTQANGLHSHAEGNMTQANGLHSHAEGQGTNASGQSSHAEGYYTITYNKAEHASGQYNVSSSASTTFGNSGNTLFSVGNGSAENARHNAFEIRQNGDIYITSGGTDVKLQDVIGKITIDQVIDSSTSASTDAVSTSAVYGFVTSYTPSITVDQVLDNTTSASTNPVSSKAVYDAVTDNELVWTNAYVALSGEVSAHTANTEIHVTAADKEKLHTHNNKSALDSITGNVGTMAYENANSYSSATEVNTALGNKLEASDVANFFNDAKYELSGTTHVINFYNGNTVKATIDADDFIKDGMISAVTLDTKSGTTYLVIEWNTDAGIQTTELNIGDLFEADNYYTKSQTSGATELSTAFGNKADTATTLAGYGITDAYTKSETSGATEISNALGGKVNSATFTGHTADTTVHFSGDEKEHLDSLATNIAAISGITSTKVSNWDTAYTNNHTHSNKTALDSITGSVGTMAYQNTSSYSSATQVNTALADKVDTTAFTSHTGSSVHMTTTEKTNLDSLATNIAAISGITATKVSNWDTAYTNNHTHSNKTALDGITGNVGTMAYQDASSYSSATQVNTALAGKSGTGHTHASSGVTAMTGYAKAASGSSIATGDTLNQAIGKLEAYVDDLNGQSETIAAALNELNTNKLDASALTEVNSAISDLEDIVGSGYTNTTITAVIENMDQAVAAAITDLNDKIGDIESILATI